MPNVLKDKDLLTALADIVGLKGIITGNDVAARYPGFFMDEILAKAIVRPRTTAEVSKVLALCNDIRQPVVVQGGMSGWVRATQTKPDDIALSLELLDEIELIDPVNRTAVVQAGVVLENFQEQLKPYNLIFPIDLGGRGSCQIGGNAATNAGGIRVIRYGMMREQILGLEVVLPDGTIVSSLNSMIKNNTGYDIKQCFIGSEGTLGVITKLVVRLREEPTSSNTAIASVATFEKVTRFLRHVDGALGGQLSAFELIDSDFYKVNTGKGRHRAPLQDDSPYYVIVESLGSDPDRDLEIFENVLMSTLESDLASDIVVAKSESERAAIWNIREDLEYIVADYQPFYAFDVSLPVGDMENYMTEVRKMLLSRWSDGRIAFLGHVGDGNLHIAIGAGNAEDRHDVEACIYEPLRSINGSVSAEHGIGLEKKSWLNISRSKIERQIMWQLKSTFDPNNILNPGKIFDVDEQG